MSKITKLVFLFFIIYPLHAQDFSEIDINLDNLSFQQTIIPLQRLNNTFPKNIEVLVRLSAAHHFLSEETNDKKVEKLNMDPDKVIKYIPHGLDKNKFYFFPIFLLRMIINYSITANNFY